LDPLINLLHLKFFCDAVTYNSITEAAKRNFVTQPTISQAIAKLERVLGADLIACRKQKFQVTLEGKILFEQARHVFKTVHDIHEKIKVSRESIGGKIKFACTNSLAMSFIAPSYKRMQENMPGVEMNIQLGNLQYIKNALVEESVEFAIVVLDHSFIDFNKYTLQRGLFNLYQTIDTPHYLIETGLLVDDKKGMHVSSLQKYFVCSLNSPLKIQAELAGWEVVARFAEQDIGVGFFPDYLVANGRYPTLRENPMSIPSFEYEIAVVYKKKKQLSKAALAFIDQFTLE
jgi:DNA-binding transcriptional LysR family regulator